MRHQTLIRFPAMMTKSTFLTPRSEVVATATRNQLAAHPLKQTGLRRVGRRRRNNEIRRQKIPSRQLHGIHVTLARPTATWPSTSKHHTTTTTTNKAIKMQQLTSSPSQSLIRTTIRKRHKRWRNQPQNSTPGRVQNNSTANP